VGSSRRPRRCTPRECPSQCTPPGSRSILRWAGCPLWLPASTRLSHCLGTAPAFPAPRAPSPEPSPEPHARVGGALGRSSPSLERLTDRGGNFCKSGGPAQDRRALLRSDGFLWGRACCLIYCSCENFSFIALWTHASVRTSCRSHGVPHSRRPCNRHEVLHTTSPPCRCAPPHDELARLRREAQHLRVGLRNAPALPCFQVLPPRNPKP
jgi:hypothetical protein